MTAWRDVLTIIAVSGRTPRAVTETPEKEILRHANIIATCDEVWHMLPADIEPAIFDRNPNGSMRSLQRRNCSQRSLHMLVRWREFARPVDALAVCVYLPPRFTCRLHLRPTAKTSSTKDSHQITTDTAAGFCSGWMDGRFSQEANTKPSSTIRQEV